MLAIYFLFTSLIGIRVAKKVVMRDIMTMVHRRPSGRMNLKGYSRKM